MSRLFAISALLVLYLVTVGNALAIPAIDIEKLTNGVDADDPADAPHIAPGETVTWSFIVTNTGTDNLVDVVVIDDQFGGTIFTIANLDPGDVFTDFLSSTALDLGGGFFSNIATAIGTSNEGDAPVQVADEDPSYYRNPTSSVPEPTTLALIGLGLAGLGYRRKKVKTV